MNYTIKQLADIAGITVRTLHYYDEIGLLTPSFIHDNGYRYYEDKEVLRLQQILFFRELEFSLEQIKLILNATDFDEKKVLTDQKKMLEIKRKKLDRLIYVINKTLEGGEQSMNSTLFDPFKDDDYLQYKEEVQQRWGKTEAYKQSMERMKKWSKQDLERIKNDGIKITKDIALLIHEPVNSSEVQNAIQRHYEHMNIFYECSYEMYKNLGIMYVTDSRFQAYYEKFVPGLAQFMNQAITTFADNHLHKK